MATLKHRIEQKLGRAAAEAVRDAKARQESGAKQPSDAQNIDINAILGDIIPSPTDIFRARKGSGGLDSWMPTTQGQKNMAEKALKTFDETRKKEKTYAAGLLRDAQDEKEALSQKPGGRPEPASNYLGLPSGEGKEKIIEAGQREKLQAAVDQAGASIKAAEDRQKDIAYLDQAAALPEEDRLALDTYRAYRNKKQFSYFMEAPAIDPEEFRSNESYIRLTEKYGADAVKGMAYALDKRETEKTMQDTARYAEQAVDNVPGAIAHSAASVGANLLSGPARLLGRAAELQNLPADYNGVSVNTIGDIFGTYSDSVRGKTAQNIAGDGVDENGNQVDGGALRQFLAYAYQGGMSAADSFVRAYTFGGGGGAVLAAADTFGKALSEATANGASPEQAARLAATSAAIEAITEKLSLDKLLTISKGGSSGVKKLLKDTIGQGALEVGEEELSFFLSTAAEAQILRGNSSYQRQVGDLVASGMSYEDARAQADKDILAQARETALVSFLSGTVSGGASHAYGKLSGGQAAQPDPIAAATEGLVDPSQPTNPEAPVVDEGQQIVDAVAAELAQQAPRQEAQPVSPAQAQLDQVTAQMLGMEPDAGTAPAQQGKEYISLEDYANQESPVWKNVDYTDDATKATITQETHEKMVESGAVVKVAEDVTKRVDQSFPDLRSMKKKERVPILKEAINTLKNNIRQYLGSIGNQSFEFEVNGKILEAKLYGTGINEVLEKVTQQKAEMLYSSEEIFRNAQYLYSTSDYDGDPNVYRWNYFYTPVQIGEEIVGVRIAVRDMATPKESQIYNWGIKKDTSLDGVGRGTNDRISHGVSSDVSNNSIPQTAPEVNENTAQESAYYDEFEEWGKGSNRDGVENPMSDRNYSEVAKRSVKAYMYENPAVKPFYQEQAAWLLSEMADSTKGERTYNDQQYYESGGEKGWSGTKRHTSESIAALIDQDGLTYDQIERGLNAIINDHGQENNAASKRIEFVINDRLMNGYTDFYTGERVPGNAEYLNMLRNQQSTPDVDIQRPSTEGGQQPLAEQAPGIKGTGAAESNFSQKPAYNATLSEDNAQADRRDDVRPMELPQQDINGGNVSAVTGNVYGSKITPDEFASLMEEPVARGDFSYARISNDQATQMATKTISIAGTWENAYDSWKQSVTHGNAGAEMSARGALFLNHAAQQENKQLWLETLHYMQKLGTNTAQGLQAFRIIRTLKPVDKIEFVKMSVDKMAVEFEEKYGIDLEIDQTLIDEFEQAETDTDRDAVLEDIQQNVADQIPSTFLDKWTALRYMNMLGNLKTNVRNTAGNVGSAAVYRIKDTIATGMEAIASKATGGKTERTKSLFVRKPLLNACKEDFQQFRETVSSSGKYGERMSATSQFAQGVQDKRRIFKNPVLEAYRKGTSWMMNNAYFGDEAFGRAAYSRALAGYLQANGVTGSDLSQVDSALLDKARAYAVKEAQEATFHDNSALAKIVSNVQKDTGVVGQGIMPFTKTPANVLTRAEEFSPLGLINSTVKSIQKARGNENITGADVVNSWAKSITGVGLFALGAAMMDQGLLTGGPDEDDEKAAFDELNGQQNYAIQLPDGTNYTIDWLTPAAMPMFMGAQFWKMLSSDRDLTFADMEQVFTSIADPMIQMSMLQGLNDSLDGIKYSDNNIAQFFINSSVSYLTQGLSNTLMGQLERSGEENRMTTFVDKDSAVPQWMQRQLGKMSQKVPGWDYQQAEYLNAWGQTEKNEGGLPYNLLSPGYVSKEQRNQVSSELYRLREATGENVFPQTVERSVNFTDTDGTKHIGYNLSEKEYETMQRVQGQASYRLMLEVISNPDYAGLTDKQKAKVVDNIYSFAKEEARKQALPKYYSDAPAWMHEMGEESADGLIRRAALSAINTTVTNTVDNIENGWTVTPAATQDLNALYDAYDSMSQDAKKQILDDAISDTAKYLEIRSRGVSTEKYLDVVTDIKALKPDPNYSAIRDIQTREAIAENDSLSAKEKDYVMKAYMTDYDPKAKSPHTTELKYDEIRKLGVSPEGYTAAYRDYLDASGTGKRWRTIAQYMKTYGWDHSTAQKVYDIYAGKYKPWEK